MSLTIEMRYFAIVRETLGRAEERRTVADGASAGEVFDGLVAEEPRLARLRTATMLMVNQRYVRADHVLEEGDELALIPPVSGGGEDGRFRVGPAPLDARVVEAMVADPEAGAIVAFTGTVRHRARGREVVALEYEAYGPAAERMLGQIGKEIAARWGIERVAIAHRTGRLAVGEASVVIAIATPHRQEGFAACAYAIERLKEIVPIWKKEHYADGAVWIGSEAEYRKEVASERSSAGEAVDG